MTPLRLSALFLFLLNTAGLFENSPEGYFRKAIYIFSFLQVDF